MALQQYPAHCKMRDFNMIIARDLDISIEKTTGIAIAISEVF
jgi:hypothetical protein